MKRNFRLWTPLGLASSITMPIALALALSNVGCATPPPADTPERRAEFAAQLAHLAATHGQFDQVLDDGAELARQVGSPALELELERPLTEDEQSRMRQLMRDLLVEFVSVERWEELVAAVYAEHFTADELARTLVFYDTPLGYKIVQTRGPITRQIKTTTRTMFDSRLEEFIERADAAMNAEFGIGTAP